MTQFALRGLLDKRSEIIREQAILEKDLARCRDAIARIDEVIRLFDPDHIVGSCRTEHVATPDAIFRPGEAGPAALDVLRNADGPLTSTEIVARMLRGKGDPQISEIERQRLLKKVTIRLNDRVRQGIVRKLGRVQGANRALLWALT